MLLTIDVPELEDLAGAAASVFQQLHVDRVEIVHVAQASSRRRMTYLVDAASAGGCATTVRALDTALDDFEAVVACDEHVALVAAVGEGSADKPATLGKMMEVLRKAGVPVLGSSQQTSNVALVVVVPALRAQKAVEAVHEAFIGKQPASARVGASAGHECSASRCASASRSDPVRDVARGDSPRFDSDMRGEPPRYVRSYEKETNMSRIGFRSRYLGPRAASASGSSSCWRITPGSRSPKWWRRTARPGKRYREATEWRLDADMPDGAADLVVKDYGDELTVRSPSPRCRARSPARSSSGWPRTVTPSSPTARPTGWSRTCP